jgi:hypothetical protein
MSVITPSIARFLSVRLNALALGRISADTASEIPPEMLRHLRNQGIAFVVSWPVWMVGGMTSLGALFDYLGWFPLDLSPASVGINFGVQMLGALIFAPYFMRAPLKRELNYRHKNGKWRWER